MITNTQKAHLVDILAGSSWYHVNEDGVIVYKHKQGLEVDLVAVEAYINAFDVDALVKEQQRVALKKAREEALQDLSYTFADTSVVQIRPQDLTNFQIAVQKGVSRDWVMKDNSIRMTTLTELQEAMDFGIAQGDAIWTTYIEGIKAL